MPNLEFFDTVFGPFTYKEWILGLFAFGFVLHAYGVMKAKLAYRSATRHPRHGRCRECGWKGTVSSHNRTCPRCKALIERV